MLVCTLPPNTRSLVVTLYLSGVQNWTDTSAVSPVVTCTNVIVTVLVSGVELRGVSRGKQCARDLLAKLDTRLQFPDPVI